MLHRAAPASAGANASRTDCRRRALCEAVHGGAGDNGGGTVSNASSAARSAAGCAACNGVVFTTRDECARLSPSPERAATTHSKTTAAKRRLSPRERLDLRLEFSLIFTEFVEIAAHARDLRGNLGGLPHADRRFHRGTARSPV